MLFILSLLNSLLLLGALFYLLRSLKQIKGSRIEGILISLGFFLALLLIRSIYNLIEIPPLLDAYSTRYDMGFILESTAYLSLIFCSYFIFRNYRRSFVPFLEKGLMILLLAGSFFLIVAASRSLIAYYGANTYTLRTSVLIGMGLFMSVILVPAYANYFKTPFFFPWCRIGIGLLLLTAVNYLQMVVETRSLGLVMELPTECFRTFSFWLLMIGLLTFRRAQLKVNLPVHQYTAKETIREVEALEGVFTYLVESLFELYGAVYGHANQKGLEKKWNAAVEKEGDSLKFKEGKLSGVPAPLELLEQAERLQKRLELAHRMLVDYCGFPFVHRMIRQLCQELYWTEKDIADNYLFSKVDFGRKYVSLDIEKEIPLEDLLIQNPVFFHLSEEERRYLALRFKRKFFRSGKKICREGRKGDQFFVIGLGECDVLKRRGLRQSRVVHLRQGDFFGEKALLEDVPRAATVKARTILVAYVLKKEDFLMVLKRHFDVLTKLKLSFGRIDFLSEIPLFAPFSQTQLLYMSSKMKELSFPAGHKVLTQGEKGTHFYVIVDGEAEVFVTAPGGTEKVIARLSRGECFGEMALIQTGVRTASVRAVSKLICFEMEKIDFDRLFKGCDYPRRKLENLVRRREEDLQKKSS